MRPQGGHFISLFIEELWWFMQHNSYGVWCGCDVAEFLHEKCQTDSAGEFSISHTSLPYFCFKNRKFHLKWNYFLKLFLNSVSWLDKDWEMWNPNINECRCKETGPLVYHWWRGEVVQPLRKTGWWFLKNDKQNSVIQQSHFWDICRELKGGPQRGVCFLPLSWRLNISRWGPREKILQRYSLREM